LGPATGTPVVIGNIGEYSGAVGASLASGQPMVQVVAKWLNAHGGLNNHPIKIITADDQSDPSRYLALAKDMVENQHAIAFLGNMVPLSAPGADPYLTQKGVAVIGGDGAAPLWFQSPDMFFAGTTYAGLASGSLSYMVQQKKPKVAALYCGEAAPCRAYNQAFGAAAPGKGAQVVYTAQISLAQPDFTAECLQAQSHGAQVLSLGMDADSVVRVTRSCVQQGYRPLFATASLVLVNSLAQDPDTNGIIATVPTFPWFQNDLPGEHDYHQAIQQYAPNLPTSTSTSAEWIAGLMLQAAGAHLPANPVPADIQNGLWSIKDSTFGGLTPPTTFTKGQPSPAQNCYYLVQNRDGQWVGPNGSQPLC
jgi:branched-chain amino acid transport system substrate-binding protein